VAGIEIIESERYVIYQGNSGKPAALSAVGDKEMK
jgi:hypothetical protein